MSDVSTTSVKERVSGYELFMLVLCAAALLALVVERTAPFTPEARHMFQYADLAVCALFFGDFLRSLVKAPDRWRYFRTWGWIDLLSSIPMVDALRAGRLARILRIFRLLRGVRVARLVVDFALTRRAESAVLAASLLTILTISFAGVAVLQFEDVESANIKTPEDAVWWSLVTLTTVGYGDRFPVTSEGRLVGALLMVLGVGLVGTFSGLAASWFLAPAASRNRSEIELVRAELADLRRLLETVVGRATPPRPPGIR